MNQESFAFRRENFNIPNVKVTLDTFKNVEIEIPGVFSMELLAERSLMFISLRKMNRIRKVIKAQLEDDCFSAEREFLEGKTCFNP